MTDIRQTLESAVEAHRAGKLAEAEKLYKQVLAADQNHVDAWRLLGVVASQVGKFEIAVQLIGRAVQIRPDLPEGWTDLAEALTGMGKLEDAKVAYEKAIAIRPTFAGARANLGEVLNKLGRTEEAMACWREAARLDPKLPEPPYNMGGVLFAQGKPDEAAEYFRRAIEVQPGFSPAHNNLGAVLWSQGKRKEASECFCRAVELNPKYAEAWNNLGSVWDEGGKHEEAMECWTKAIALRPGYAEAHNNLGVALEKRGARAAAIKEWQEASRLRPDWEVPKYYLAAAMASDAPAPTGPPAEYVAKLFDEYADKFDQHLLGTLEYRVPDLLVAAVKRAGASRFEEVMDLGCGTGLCGEKFRPMAGRMVGVDLSTRMIEKARQRGIYDELMVGGLAEALRGREGDVDLVLAGDVLGYVGDLSELFRAAQGAMRQGGLFAFSVEKPSEKEGEGLVLRRTRRFAHSKSYVERTAREAGMEVVEMSEAVIRLDDQKPIEGMIVVVRRR
ncbi:MAG TPA: tetratricopeptide repeat protein [Tepidisphaeraceae bacterium]|nr:tetratricopeptide repeat protein [Tepidisphaeraceae bacterium]